MSARKNIQADLADAMRAGDKDRRDTLRMLLAAIQQVEVDERVELDDAGVASVLAKQAKQRRESIADAVKAGRSDLADQEKLELQIINAYLPDQMTEVEVRTIAAGIISELGAKDIGDMGRVMGQLMPEVKGKADGRVVSEVVRSLLTT